MPAIGTPAVHHAETLSFPPTKTRRFASDAENGIIKEVPRAFDKGCMTAITIAHLEPARYTRPRYTASAFSATKSTMVGKLSNLKSRYSNGVSLRPICTSPSRSYSMIAMQPGGMDFWQALNQLSIACCSSVVMANNKKMKDDDLRTNRILMIRGGG